MNIVILAGGRGTRMGEITESIPKPLVPIGGRPLLWHIMSYYVSIISCPFFHILGGYKYELIEEFIKQSEFDIITDVWDTGNDTKTGDRLLAIQDQLIEDFMLTYGDGLSNIPLKDLVAYHRASRKVATISGVHPPGRFGTLTIREGKVVGFNEKGRLLSEWINGGFMVMSPAIFKYIQPGEMLEFTVFPRLVEFQQLGVYLHDGWWQCMDTARDKDELERLWNEKFCPWMPHE